MSTRITAREIMKRLKIGDRAVYAMLDSGMIPAVRIGRRWIISRHAYEEWERTFGTKDAPVAALSFTLPRS